MVRRAGIEVSTVRISELINRRIDAECYRQEFLQIDSWEGFYPLKDLCLIRSGTTPSDRDDELRKGVILLKTTDVRNNVLSKEDSSSFYYINKDISERMKATVLQPADVLINIVGATTDVIGRVAYVPHNFPEANITQAMALLRVTDKRLNPAFLFSFLAGRYGNKQVRRYARPTGQYNLNLQEVSNFRIPLSSEEFQEKIERLVKTALTKLESSKKFYIDAENLLAAELGLDKLDLSESLFSIRNLSDAQNATRIDAEYYKPKYQRLLDHLRKTGQSVKLVDWIREPLKRGVQPEYSESGEVIVINSQHVGKTHVELEDNRFTTKEFCQIGSNKRALVKQYDVLLNSTGYITIGRSQTLLEKIDAIVDGHITIIRPKDEIDPVYLGLYLNSLPGQLQTERGWTGSSGQIELRIDIIENFLIWKAPTKVQRKIRQMIEQAHQARKEAKRLLSEAKQEVEKLIEGN